MGLSLRAEHVITDKEAKAISRIEELSYELRIGEVMTRNFVSVTPDMQMEQVLDLFRQARISGAPVVADGDLVGILSIEDLIRCLRAGDTQSKVTQYMAHQVVTVRATDSVIEALKLFTQKQYGRLPVVDESGKPVGILTKGDITRGVLRALESDYQMEELRRYRASHLFEDIVSDRSSLILRYTIAPKNFAHGGEASSNIKRALLRLGATPQIARRCGIAVYEAEMNLVLHTPNGGTITAEIEPHLINIRVEDDGPGIEDLSLAMKPGYSTASEQVRELGFGAGMGLPNIERCVDEMLLESVVGVGTTLAMKIDLRPLATEQRPCYFVSLGRWEKTRQTINSGQAGEPEPEGEVAT
jgi:CBS domain-containing protein/anti-sigma regulatory factor (Ser/Thr protein kinase)